MRNHLNVLLFTFPCLSSTESKPQQSKLAKFLEQYKTEIQVMNDFNELESFLHEKINHMLDGDADNIQQVHRIRSQERTSELDSVLTREKNP